jgi:FkbM family methyltransferase
MNYENTLIPFKKLIQSDCEHLSTGETSVLGSFLQNEGVIIDVGGFRGDWTQRALQFCPHGSYHIFEADSDSYKKILNHFKNFCDNEIVINNIACAQKIGMNTFCRYEKHPSWNTLHRRISVENKLGIAEPTMVKVPTISLDDYCLNHNIRRIHFAKIDAEGAEFSIIKGMQNLIKQNRVDFFQFEYGGTFKDSNSSLSEVFDFISNYKYDIYKISDSGLIFISSFHKGLEDYKKCDFLVVHKRLFSWICGYPPKMMDFPTLLQKSSISCKGIIHVGAHQASEISAYKKLGFEDVIFIEANPKLAQELEKRFMNDPKVSIIEGAATDFCGHIDLNIASGDAQSSSILPLGEHQFIYPSIKYQDTVEVQCFTLDSIFNRYDKSISDFNVLNIDVQGAELLVLSGARELLKNISALNIEVNFAHLYKECALFEDIDDLLTEAGFELQDMKTPYHPSWGDAFYVKRKIIKMSDFGKNGRFANQLFQYTFLSSYALQHNLDIRLPEWQDGKFFNIKTNNNDKEFKKLKEPLDREPDVLRLFDFNTVDIIDKDISGYFQFHTSCYKPFKEKILSTFEINSTIANSIEKDMFSIIPKNGGTLIALHIRRGDYGNGYFHHTPSDWYKTWLNSIWNQLYEPVLYIATDAIQEVSLEFSDFTFLTSENMIFSKQNKIPDHIIDFQILRSADLLAIANSTFGFMASMLNTKCNVFVRSHLPSKGLISYDPWNAPPLFFHKENNLV